ncbi:proton channel OtopLc-like isoform X3 [Chironomus tepperi]|uniref:proton channel OtopLc-like isoform X3 n=1 Tax=Chironomus tepperi TaxID=113505 RepID=UPI00391F4402
MSPVKNNIWNQAPKIVIDDVDALTNHKPTQPYQTQLSIVEEGENPESPTDNKENLKLLHSIDDSRVPTPHSSSENITTNNNRRNRHYLSPDFAEHHGSGDEKHPHNSSRRGSVQILQEFLSSRRSSTIMAALRRPSLMLFRSKHEDPNDPANKPEAIEQRRKNRRIGNDALSTALSALYAKIVVIIGIALPITELLSQRIPSGVYQGFYVYLYFVSISFVVFIYAAQLKNRAMLGVIKDYHAKSDADYHATKKRAPHFGSFYLRVGAIAFGIGTMVYSGLELGQYFEMNNTENAVCNNLFNLLQPSFRMLLAIVQIQFIFLNTNDLDMGSHKVISRFGLMHMVATNLCEWLYTLIEETKHEIWHLSHESHSHEGHGSDAHFAELSDNHNLTHAVHNATETVHDIVRRSVQIQVTQKYQECQRTNIMGSLVQNSSPFLFPCTIEYSLICAVILFEMWKKVKSIPEINKARKSSLRNATHPHKNAYHFSIDCSKAQRGMFAGIVVIVLTIISLIMYFVLHDKEDYLHLAIKEVTYYEILLYTVTGCAVLMAFFKMRDLKYHRPSANDHHADSVKLDCTLLVLAGLGVYVYGMFSIMGSVFAVQDDLPGSGEGLVAEILSLIEVSLQTLFVLNACWRRCRGAQQNRTKPGRQIITFLLVANISMWFINTLIKGHAAFRPTHLEFFGTWAWVIITHVSMPLAIFYRYHSTICLFDIWKSAYKVKTEH